LPLKVSIVCRKFTSVRTSSPWTNGVFVLRAASGSTQQAGKSAGQRLMMEGHALTDAPKSEPKKPQVSKPDREKRPLEVSHGEKIMTAILDSRQEVQETRQGVVATKSDTAEILGLLSPRADETDPVMEALERIERQMQERFNMLNLRLIAIEQQLGMPRG
jgi:hypothetical protein